MRYTPAKIQGRFLSFLHIVKDDARYLESTVTSLLTKYGLNILKNVKGGLTPMQ